MVKVEFPSPKFRIKKEGDKEFVLDEIRKQWVRLTPEEWVRQNFIRFLVEKKGYPSALLGIEKELEIGELKKRFDLLVYNQQHQPSVMVECKAMDVELSDATIAQLLRYHSAIPVPFLYITNGTYTYGWKKVNGEFISTDSIPFFEEL